MDILTLYQTMIHAHERHLGKPYSEWDAGDWEKIGKLLVTTANLTAATQRREREIVDIEQQLTMPPTKRGRPKRKPGLWIFKEPPIRPGRRPKPHRRELSIAVHFAVENEKETLRNERQRPTDKVAINRVLARLAATQGCKSKRCKILFIQQKFGRARKLLTEGRKLVTKSRK